MNNEPEGQCENFIRQFEAAAQQRCLSKIYFSPHKEADGSARYCNDANNTFIECVVMSNKPGRLMITVARGRFVSEMMRLHSRIPGCVKTAYSWSEEGWQTPAGLKLDSQRLAMKVIDDAL